MGGDIRLAKLGTVMLGVSDLGRSVAFYRDALGLPLQSSTGGFAFFDGGGVTLCLHATQGLAAPADERSVELVFHVEDIHAAHGALSARGVPFRSAPRPVTGDQHAADFRDPDGHVLSIFGPRR
ncbi:MAG: VOC family protein [Candidatus Lambdaproteobacteria bacterium]|nr:VOC family protein [Candidatus Lambdaproteobacteria bacterium]